MIRFLPPPILARVSSGTKARVPVSSETRATKANRMHLDFESIMVVVRIQKRQSTGEKKRQPLRKATKVDCDQLHAIELEKVEYFY